MNETTHNSESKHRTWTDTYYSLSADDWLFSAKTTFEGGEEGVALKCPGYSRDGNGFVIEFKVQHLDVLKSLVAELESLKAEK